MDILTADYHNPQHMAAIADLMEQYSSDPFGGGQKLNREISRKIAAELARREFAFTLLGYVDNQAMALANCFELFSTFACRPLINIHDIVVAEPYRGRGFSHQLLHAVEALAKARGCCKLTLEVLSNNHVAKASYQTFGFGDYQLNPEHGHALYWQKTL